MWFLAFKPMDIVTQTITVSGRTYIFVSVVPGQYYMVAQAPTGYRSNGGGDAGESTINQPKGQIACLDMQVSKTTGGWGAVMTEGSPDMGADATEQLTPMWSLCVV